MPSGPKKRRASRRKKGGNGNGNAGEGEEENLELHESVSNVFGVQKADHVVDEIGSKESQSVDIQMGLKENVKESEAVTVVDESKSEFGEVGDGLVVVMKEGEMMSMEGVFEEPMKEPIERSYDEVVKIVDQSILKVIPMDEAQDLSVSETKVETSIKDGQDSLESSSLVNVSPVKKEAQDSFQSQLGSPSLGYMSPGEGEVPFKGYGIEAVGKVLDQMGSQKEAQEHSLPDESVDIQDSSIDDVSPVEGVVHKTEFTQVGDVESVLKEDGDISMEGVVEEEEESLEEPIEVKAVVKSVYQWVLNVIPSTHHAEDPSVPIKSHPETSIKDVQDSSIEPLHEDEDEESVMKEDEEMPMKDVVEEPQTMVKPVDQLVIEKEAEEPFVQDKSVIEVNVDTSLKDEQDSSKQPLESQPSLSEITFVASNVHLNGYEIEPTDECSSNETQAMVIESHTETSLKDDQDSFKEKLVHSSMDDVSSVRGIVQGTEFTEVNERAAMVNRFESVYENEEMSIEGVLEETSEVLHVGSSDEPHTLVKTVDQSILNLIPLRETRDLSVPNHESVTKLNVETSFRDGQDSFKKPMGGSSVVDVSLGQWNGQRDEMVGLVRTLLEEIRRIRIFYEEGLRQTTEIHLHICRVLEKFESGEQI